MASEKTVAQVDADLTLAVNLVKERLTEGGLLAAHGLNHVNNAALTALVRRVYSQLTWDNGRLDRLYEERAKLLGQRIEIAVDHNFLLELRWRDDEPRWPLPLQRIAEKYKYPLPDRERIPTLHHNVRIWLLREIEAIDRKVVVLNGEIERLKKS